MQLRTFLGILADTRNLTLATANATAYNPASRRSPGSTSPPRSRSTPLPPSTGCSRQGPDTTDDPTEQALGSAVGQSAYDKGLFSYVGCRCNRGFDNVYTLAETGGVRSCTGLVSLRCSHRFGVARVLLPSVVHIIIFVQYPVT